MEKNTLFAEYELKNEVVDEVEIILKAKKIQSRVSLGWITLKIIYEDNSGGEIFLINTNMDNSEILIFNVFLNDDYIIGKTMQTGEAIAKAQKNIMSSSIVFALKKKVKKIKFRVSFFNTETGDTIEGSVKYK